jgi:hypothetical protein
MIKFALSALERANSIKEKQVSDANDVLNVAG